MNGHRDQSGWNASSGRNAQSVQKNQNGQSARSDQNGLEETEYGRSLLVWSGYGAETVSAPSFCVFELCGKWLHGRGSVANLQNMYWLVRVDMAGEFCGRKGMVSEDAEVESRTRGIAWDC